MFGNQGIPLIRLALKAATEAATGDDQRVAVLSMVVAGGIDPTKVKWPRANAGRLESRRRDRYTVRDTWQREFGAEFLDVGGRSNEYLPSLRAALAKYTSARISEPDLADLAMQAKWGVHPREYGEPTRESKDRVRGRLLALQIPIREDPSATLNAEVRKCREAHDLDTLAGWWDLLRSGVRLLSQGIAAFQRFGLAEALSEPGGESVDKQAKGIHNFLYVPRPEFALSSNGWSHSDGVVRLRLGRPLSDAKQLLPGEWWSHSMTAVARGESTTFRDPRGDYVALLHALAEYRAVGRTKQDEKLVFAPGDKLHNVGGPSWPPIDDEVRSILSGDPMVWEVFRRTEGGELGKDVAADLQIAPARVSQLRKKALKMLSESVYLRDIWDSRTRHGGQDYLDNIEVDS